jgi:signal transduction histidine kinase
MSDAPLSRGQVERLLGVGRALVSELDLEALLGQVLEAARDLTGARYAALGVLDAEKQGLERFVYLGLDEETRQRIGPLPRGRGVLGELIRRPEPLRCDDVSAHPHSVGFPAGHPEMRTFLGVPITIRGEAWGNLYLSEKAGGQPFGENDERLVVVLAEWAAVAIDNARLHGGLERRQAELERAVHGLETNAALARAGASGMEVDRLVRLIAKRGRDLVGARRVLLLLPEGEGLVVAAAAGEGARELEGTPISADEPILADASRDAGPRSFANAALPESSLGGLGATQAALVTTLEFRGGERGALVALDPLARANFEAGDERLFESFAASAVTTLSIAQAAETEKLRLAMEASEQERRRWARELHDETLQELGALRVIIDAVKDAREPARAGELLRRAADHIERSIGNLQGLITELRPAALDQLGIAPAVDALVERVGDVSGLRINVELERLEQGRRLPSELEATIYRLIQEALNNVVKHAGASATDVRVVESNGLVEVIVRDDGRGFDPNAVEGGFGLVGMRERAALVGGRLAISSQPGSGTELRVRLPVRGARSPGDRPAASL